MPSYTAFVQSLCNAFADETGDTEVWTKEHLLMGMVRLLDSCRSNYSRSDNHLDMKLPVFTPKITEASRSYIHASPGDTKCFDGIPTTGWW